MVASLGVVGQALYARGEHGERGDRRRFRWSHRANRPGGWGRRDFSRVHTSLCLSQVLD